MPDFSNLASLGSYLNAPNPGTPDIMDIFNKKQANQLANSNALANYGQTNALTSEFAQKAQNQALNNQMLAAKIPYANSLAQSAAATASQQAPTAIAQQKNLNSAAEANNFPGELGTLFRNWKNLPDGPEKDSAHQVLSDYVTNNNLNAYKINGMNNLPGDIAGIVSAFFGTANVMDHPNNVGSNNIHDFTNMTDQDIITKYPDPKVRTRIFDKLIAKGGKAADYAEEHASVLVGVPSNNN